ncbi:mucin-2-like [Protopterus annectens]|uniref:mucin-2-like n=1 Tax=Protopterus annectens TaxID=7888 RepID=UPI001CFB0CEA|nr:mucin-2-like [Protopterus annectens]
MIKIIEGITQIVFSKWLATFSTRDVHTETGDKYYLSNFIGYDGKPHDCMADMEKPDKSPLKADRDHHILTMYMDGARFWNDKKYYTEFAVVTLKKGDKLVLVKLPGYITMGKMKANSRVPLWILAFLISYCIEANGQGFEDGSMVTIIPSMTPTVIITSVNPAHNNLVCSTWGNFHFKTFDGDIYRFPGICNYIFASHCKAVYEEFNIQLRRILINDVPVIQYVTMKLDGIFIKLMQSNVSINNEQIQLPYSQSGIMIEKNNAYINVKSKLGILFKWNMNDAAMLQLDSKYMNQTCGLCGDFNGIQIYNEFVSNDVLLNPIEFGNLQKMDGPTEQCEDPIPITPSNCSDYRSECQNFLTDAVFGDCNAFVDVGPYVQSCILDMCNCVESSNNCMCSVATEYSRQCAHAGGEPKNWRTNNFCTQQCPFNMQYQECNIPCVNTCSNQERSQTCDDHCSDGCYCPPGMIYDDINNSGCVPVSNCPCTHSGTTYLPGESYTNNCQQCVCTGGQWECVELPCLATCAVEGGSHVNTFDGKLYQFHGQCYYLLSSDTDNTFSLLGELRQCGVTETESCLKSITLVLPGGDIVSEIIQIYSSGTVLVNGILTQLPLSAANVVIFRPSSFYIILQTSFGLQVQIQLIPVMQVFINVDAKYKGKLTGLCGNYNDVQSDDFTAIAGVIEGTAASFVNSWKVQSNCPEIKDSFENPCSSSVENEKYAQHWCSLLIDKNGVFSSCHSVIDPAEYRKNCMYDSCNYENSEDYMCTALSSYVQACAAKGVMLTGWRSEACSKYTTTCPQSMTYSYSVTSCQPSCRSLSDSDITCDITFAPVDGCTCAEGTFLDDSGKCVPQASCPCYFKGSSIPSGEIINQNGAMCTCNNGKLNCIGNGVVLPECQPPMVYFDCKTATSGKTGAECQRSCQTLSMECFSTECVSGCVCPNGLILDGQGRCITEEKCSCVHNGIIYNPGETVDIGCNTCTCIKARWSCTNLPCQETCAIYGEGHYISFDKRRFNFNGNCEYVLTQDYCTNNPENGTFRVITENIPCGTTGTTCSKAIKLFLGNTELKLSDGSVEVIKKDFVVDAPYQIYSMGIYSVIEAENGMVLMWDKKTSMFIKLNPSFKGEVCGLCGNYDGNANNDFTTRGQSIAVDVQEFGNSWKVSPSCPDADITKDPCSANPYREAWAQKKCSILISNEFSTCHNQVDPSQYYDSCVHDACACDTGGDCECFCTAVAAYAAACNEAGACVAWRTPDVCPLFCDYYNPSDECNWHYKACGAPCMKTCRHPSGQCLSQLPGLEGCYPECPMDKPFFDEDTMQCVSYEQCGCFDSDGNRYLFGSSVPSSKNCESCICTKDGIICKYSTEACYCIYNNVTYPYGSVIYNTTDGTGGCIIARCGANGTVNRIIYPCPISTTMPPTTYRTATPSSSQITGFVSTSTTICVKEVCQWSTWYDVSYPEYEKNGDGDFETFENIRKHHYEICDYPKDVECRAVHYPSIPIQDVGQRVICNNVTGLICHNKEQFPPICYNYEIRIFCCDYMPCEETTTSGVSTTTSSYTTTISSTIQHITTSPKLPSTAELTTSTKSTTSTVPTTTRATTESVITHIAPTTFTKEVVTSSIVPTSTEKVVTSEVIMSTTPVPASTLVTVVSTQEETEFTTIPTSSVPNVLSTSSTFVTETPNVKTFPTTIATTTSSSTVKHTTTKAPTTAEFTTTAKPTTSTISPSTRTTTKPATSTVPTTSTKEIITTSEVILSAAQTIPASTSATTVSTQEATEFTIVSATVVPTASTSVLTLETETLSSEPFSTITSTTTASDTTIISSTDQHTTTKAPTTTELTTSTKATSAIPPSTTGAITESRTMPTATSTPTQESITTSEVIVTTEQMTSASSSATTVSTQEVTEFSTVLTSTAPTASTSISTLETETLSSEPFSTITSTTTASDTTIISSTDQHTTTKAPTTTELTTSTKATSAIPPSTTGAITESRTMPTATSTPTQESITTSEVIVTTEQMTSASSSSTSLSTQEVTEFSTVLTSTAPAVSSSISLTLATETSVATSQSATETEALSSTPWSTSKYSTAYSTAVSLQTTEFPKSTTFVVPVTPGIETTSAITTASSSTESTVTSSTASAVTRTKGPVSTTKVEKSTEESRITFITPTMSTTEAITEMQTFTQTKQSIPVTTVTTLSTTQVISSKMPELTSTAIPESLTTKHSTVSVPTSSLVSSLSSVPATVLSTKVISTAQTTTGNIPTSFQTEEPTPSISTFTTNTTQSTTTTPAISVVTVLRPSTPPPILTTGHQDKNTLVTTRYSTPTSTTTVIPSSTTQPVTTAPPTLLFSSSPIASFSTTSSEKPTTFKSTQTEMTFSTQCFCSVNGTLFSPGTLIYSSSDSAGWCFYAWCSKTCEIERKMEECKGTTMTSTLKSEATQKESTTSATTKSSTTKASTAKTSKPVTSTSSTKPAGCTDLKPPREYGETWKIDNCTTATCKGWNNIIVKNVTCSNVPLLKCANGRQPVKVYDSNGCCYHYECECVCSGWGDPHYITFDGTYYTFQGNCTYILVQQITPKYHNFRIYIDNYYCDARDGLSCPRSLIIFYGPSVVVLTHQLVNKGISSQIYFNDEKITPAFQRNGIKISTSGINTIVEIDELGAYISFSGIIFTVILPFSRFGDNTEGQCGTCTNNATEDCRLPGGKIASSCSVMADYWFVFDKNKPYCRPPTPTSTTTRPPTSITPATKSTSPTTTTPCPPSPLCKLILSSLFAECHKVVPPNPFFEACHYDHCHMLNSTVDCSSLQNYATMCLQDRICIDWRGHTNGSCSIDCPPSKVYEACGPKVQPTCNSRYNDKFIEDDDDGRIEGCFCPEGTILFNSYSDLCVETCYCTGPDGMPKKPGETWQSNCNDCVCDNNTMSVRCETHFCPTIKPKECFDEGFVPVLKPDPADSCCKVYECDCNSTSCSYEPKTCDLGFQRETKIPEGKCCPVDECELQAVMLSEHDKTPEAVVPKDTCEICVCTSDVDPSTMLHEISCAPQLCTIHCDPGFEYQEVPGQCCGECIQTQCVVFLPDSSIHLLKPNETWVAPADNCTEYECAVMDNAFITITNKIVCPPFDPKECVPGSIQLTPDQCCKICTPTPKNCELHSRVNYISQNGCQSKEPVNITSCQGTCGTYSMYSAEANKMEHTCSCCQEVKTHNETIVLACPDETTIDYSYIFVDKCDCQDITCGDLYGHSPSKKKKAN